MSRASRLGRVSPERVYELARHLTERDRELALTLYQQRILTTDQLQLLFFTSRRRAQDRLLFLHRERVVDRFHPALRFGHGKAAGHWLLDEAGALLVSARLGVERKQLRWQRRDDWGSHPQLAHQLETNRFVTDLTTATLPTADLGVHLWWSSRRAAERLNQEPRPGFGIRSRVFPDTSFLLLTPAGAVECVLEWDRGTETRATLAGKLDQYDTAERVRRSGWRQPYSLLFVVPGPGRVQSLQQAYRDSQQDRFQNPVASHDCWPRLVATLKDLQADGPLGRVWWPIDPDLHTGPFTLSELPVSPAWGRLPIDETLGRRWRKDTPGFWERLSPLAANAGTAAAARASRPASDARSADLRAAGIDGSMDDPDDANDNEHEEEVVSW